MTTLAANSPRVEELGPRSHYPVIVTEIIYEGAAVGLVDGTGHARPLNVADRFAGFAVEKADNNTGAAADIDVWTVREGYVELTITGVVITDVGQPVYATDDATFTMQPVATTTSAAYIGLVKRWSSSGKAVVYFNAGVLQDPYGRGPREAVAADKTLDIQDTGKTFFVTADAKKVTLPVTATPLYAKVVNSAAFGTVLVSIDPNTADKVQGPDLPGTNNKDHLNTKATARRGDYALLSNAGDANGAVVLEQVGIWATEG